jgi:acyl carrier protein
MQDVVIRILCEVLGLDPAKARLNANSGLLGHLPEFDSMAVVAILTALEDQFGITVDDDEVDAALFETVGSLVAFVDAKLAA